MRNMITHQAVIERINDTRLFVRIMQTSACAACGAKGYCSSADRKEKIVEAVVSDPLRYKKGDVVTVVGQMSMGIKAVLLAFLLPFLLLVISLFVCMALLDGNELMSGLLSLSLLIPYYILIWLLRDKIKRNFIFTVK